jgi:hypothetical protein
MMGSSSETLRIRDGARHENGARCGTDLGRSARRTRCEYGTCRTSPKWEGLLPFIKVGDNVEGAVGVSGSPGKDDDFGQAGIDKVADQLK